MSESTVAVATPSLEETRAELIRSLDLIREAVPPAGTPESMVRIWIEAIEILEAVIRLLDAGKMSSHEADASGAKILLNYLHRLRDLKESFEELRAKVLETSNA